MSARDINIAYLKRLKTNYELRAKELELQAARYRLGGFKPFSLPHSRHYFGRGPPVVRMTSGFENDSCHCDADIEYNTLCSSRDEKRLSDKTEQPDPRDGTNESFTSLDIDLATLSTIRQLATREKETKKRIARLDKVEAAIMSLMKASPMPLKNDQKATTKSEVKPNLDSDIQSDVVEMKEVVDHLARKVKEPVNTRQEELAAYDAAPLESDQPGCPNAELASNLQESVQCASEKMPDITSTEKMMSNQGNPAEATEEVAAEPITEDEPDKGNYKMDIMKRNVNLVVDHLKVCDACPAEEFENINHDLEGILAIFHSIHDENSQPKETKTLDARDTTGTVTGGRREGAADIEHDESAMEIIDEIIAKATQIVCETIIKETEVSLQMKRQSENVENLTPKTEVGTESAEPRNEKQQPSTALDEELAMPNVEDITTRTKIDTESAVSKNRMQQESTIESKHAQAKFNCCPACACLTEDIGSAQPLLPAEDRMDRVPEEVPPAEGTPAESVPAIDETPLEVPPAEGTPAEPVLAADEAPEVPPAEGTPAEPVLAVDEAPEVPLAEDTPAESVPAIDEAPEEVPPAEGNPAEPVPAIDEAPEEVPPAEGNPAESVPAIDEAPEEVPPAEGNPAESVPAVDKAPEEEPPAIDETPLEVPPAEGTPVDEAQEEEPPTEGSPAKPVPAVGESVGCQTAITFTGRCKVNVTSISVSSVATCATMANAVDGLKKTCKCKTLGKEKPKVLPEDDKESQKHLLPEEKPLAITEPVEPLTETFAAESAEDIALNEPTAVVSPVKSAVEVPLVTPPAEVILEEPPPAEFAVEKIPQEPPEESNSLDALEELAPVEPSPDLAPVEPLEEPTDSETTSKLSHEEPVALPAPTETVAEQSQSAQEIDEEIPSKPSDTAISPVEVQSPSKVVSSKSVVKSPDPTQSPGKIPSSEKPSKPSDPVKSPAKTASTPIAVKPSKEKSPVKSVSSPIAAKTPGEKSPKKSVSSPITANTPKEKSPVKSVSSPIAAKTSREKRPVKSTTSPIAMEPKVKSPGKSGSTSSAARPPFSKQSPEKISPKGSVVKPADPKPSPPKRPSTPSTKVHRPSIGSVGSRSSAKSKSSKNSDVQHKSGCTCNRRQESPCNKAKPLRGAKNDFATGMCPSSPQRKCFCRNPSIRRESPCKGRGTNGANIDAPAEGSLIPARRNCFCGHWAKYRENHSKGKGQKGEKDQQKPPVAKKNCKCTHKKLK